MDTHITLRVVMYWGFLELPGTTSSTNRSNRLHWSPKPVRSHWLDINDSSFVQQVRNFGLQKNFFKYSLKNSWPLHSCYLLVVFSGSHGNQFLSHAQPEIEPLPHTEGHSRELTTIPTANKCKGHYLTTPDSSGDGRREVDKLAQYVLQYTHVHIIHDLVITNQTLLHALVAHTCSYCCVALRITWFEYFMYTCIDVRVVGIIVHLLFLWWGSPASLQGPTGACWLVGLTDWPLSSHHLHFLQQNSNQMT